MLEKGKTYQLKENSLLFESVFIGKYFLVKGAIINEKIDRDTIEISEYPVYIFYTKDFGIKIFYNLKSFSYEEKKIDIKEKSLKKINEEIKSFRDKGKNHKFFNTTIWKTIICLIEKKTDSFKKYID